MSSRGLPAWAVTAACSTASTISSGDLPPLPNTSAARPPPAHPDPPRPPPPVLAGGRARLGHAVGVEEHDVAGQEPSLHLAHLRVREDAEQGARLAEQLDLARRAQHDGGRVPAERQSQPPLRPIVRHRQAGEADGAELAARTL